MSELIERLGHGAASTGNGVDFSSARVEVLESNGTSEWELAGNTDTEVVVQDE